jgi:hypothetical protein
MSFDVSDDMEVVVVVGVIVLVSSGTDTAAA